MLFLFSVPPKSLVIYDGKRRELATLLEPYNEGSDVNLICEAEGGKPDNRRACNKTTIFSLLKNPLKLPIRGKRDCLYYVTAVGYELFKIPWYFKCLYPEFE